MASRFIKLNVGGTSFSVSLDNIMKHPNSLLAKKFTEDDNSTESITKKRKLDPTHENCECPLLIDRSRITPDLI